MKLRAAGLGLALAVALGATAACGDPVDPCQVNPTRTAATGGWVEADGEPLDSDPCDSDDFDGSKPKKKPTPKKTTGTSGGGTGGTRKKF